MLRRFLINYRTFRLIRAGRMADALVFVKSTRGCEGLRDFNRIASFAA